MADVVLVVQHHFSDVVRQLCGARQCSPLDHDRNDGYALRQRGRDLLANIVALVGSGARLEQIQPARSDHGDEDVGLGEGFLQLLVEALAGEQIIHVHEDMGNTECGSQPVANAGRESPFIVTPLVDEYLPRHLPQPVRNDRGDYRRSGA